jgi:hypothetical protein
MEEEEEGEKVLVTTCVCVCDASVCHRAKRDGQSEGSWGGDL